MEKPEIKRTVYDGEEIILFEAKKLVNPSGTGGHVILPKKLVNKYVKIIYKKERKGKKKK